MEIALAWHKPYNEKDAGGIFIRFDFRAKGQLKFELQVPCFRELVLQFEQMDDELKDLVIARAPSDVMTAGIVSKRTEPGGSP
jgi:hypothetical protein